MGGHRYIYLIVSTIIHEVFEKLYFSCETVNYGKSSISVFQENFYSDDNILISGREPSARQ